MAEKSTKAGEAGFTLLELLVVVSVIGIIASIAIPNLVSSKRAANEAMAISYMKSWVSAQEMYQMRYGTYADADGQLYDADLIHGRPDADMYGYIFSLDNPSGSQYTWWGRGWPDNPGVSGTRWFYVDQSGVIRYSITGSADSNDPPI